MAIKHLIGVYLCPDSTSYPKIVHRLSDDNAAEKRKEDEVEVEDDDDDEDEDADENNEN